MSKKLVAYFSASGITGRIAKNLAGIAQADLYEIKPQTPYTKGDLDWTDKQSRSTREMQDEASRPELADKNAKVAEYDVIYLGFPIWWHVAPHIINTFLESYDFSGKTVVIFATSGGSGFGGTLAKLRPSCAADVKWVEGEVFRGNADKDVLARWVDGLKF